MSHALDQELIAYFARPENLAHTFEIARYAPKVRVKVLQQFWDALTTAILADPAAGPSRGEWVVQPFDRMDLEYAAIRVLKKSAIRQRENLAFTIEHRTWPKGHSIYLGLRWNSAIVPHDPLYKDTRVGGLRARLTQERTDYVTGEWWMCRRDIFQFDSPEECILAYAADTSALLNPLVAAFWELVADTQNEVAEINRLVASR